MKAKKLFALGLALVFCFAFAAPIYAGGHRRGAGCWRIASTADDAWRDAANTWVCPWNNDCGARGRLAWHAATDYAEGFWGCWCLEHDYEQDHFRGLGLGRNAGTHRRGNFSHRR